MTLDPNRYEACCKRFEGWLSHLDTGQVRWVAERVFRCTRFFAPLPMGAKKRMIIRRILLFWTYRHWGLMYPDDHPFTERFLSAARARLTKGFDMDKRGYACQHKFRYPLAWDWGTINKMEIGEVNKMLALCGHDVEAEVLESARRQLLLDTFRQKQYQAQLPAFTGAGDLMNLIVSDPELCFEEFYVKYHYPWITHRRWVAARQKLKNKGHELPDIRGRFNTYKARLGKELKESDV